MKLKKYITAIACISLAGLHIGCSDEFLNKPPLDSIVDANFYKTDKQVLAGSAPLYNLVWFEYNDKASHGIGDGRGGVLTSGSYQIEHIEFRTTGVTQENSNAWASFFSVVAQANLLMNNIERYAGPDVSPAIKTHAIAEARFMRGLAYTFIVQNWGAVPVIENNLTLLADTSIAPNTVPSVWEFITRDMRFAMNNLPEQAVERGRLTKWSAEGMLARIYLTRAGVESSGGTRNQTFLDSAKFFAADVIDNGGFALLTNYEDLYKTVNNNNIETISALQWTYNHAGNNWGVQNSVQAFLAFSPSITGFGDGWGGDIGASYWMLDQYEGLLENGFTDDERLKPSFMLPGVTYDYISRAVINSEGKTEVVDLTVPVNNTTDNYLNRAWVKKYVVGRPEDNEGKVVQQGTEIQTYLMRLAEVYLIYAEATLGNSPSTSDALALEYFNRVRVRAGLDPVSVITWDDIFRERAVELAMEGQLWYDFVRLHYYDPAKAEGMLSNQERGFYRIYPDNLVNATSWTFTLQESRKYNVNSGNFYLPFPDAEISRAPNLLKPAVPWTPGGN